ncbi:separin-like [Amphibalanus amphitrite]|uniref:separin-like n=1 Tax=Amphibalanus amphitrite TaxID=1232801 RepID=UPI001C91C568|nr:separin-like [Amphibalanus amphitrite]
METLLRGASGLRLDDSVSTVSDLLDTEPSAEALPALLEGAERLCCGSSHNSLVIQRALQYLSAGQPLEALHYLAESHSTTLRQYMIMKSSCRLVQSQVKSGDRVSGWPAGTQEALLDSRRRQLQYKSALERRQEIVDLINLVPPDWTVIQLTAVPRARSRLTRHDTPELVVSRFQGGDPDSVLLTRVPAPASDHCCSFLSQFEAMLADNGSIQRSLSNDRHKYWAERGLLDERMKSIVRSMEVAWLGRHAYLLAGCLLRPQHRRAVAETVAALPASLSGEQRARLALLAARLPETAGDLADGVAAALGPSAPVELRRTVTETLAERRDDLEDASAGARRGQVLLVLDREVQRYPWETVAGLALGPACRLPSLAILGLCLTSRSQRPAPPAAAAGATYILNPAGDLVNTEQRMGPFLEQRGWNGIVGRPPTLKEFSAALTEGQVMAYCGHGSGSQYLPTEKLRALHCNAVALLFGCSSGQLVQPGPTADPHGSVLAYLMANCPAILGNLWPVTDNMLDTYSKAVIEQWTDGPGGRSLPEAVSAARSSVTSWFMAAAPVVYGLPVTADHIRPRQPETPCPAAQTMGDTSRLNAAGDQSKLDASVNKSRLNATMERSKARRGEDRLGLDATADSSKLNALTDRTNMTGVPDSSCVGLLEALDRDDRATEKSRADTTRDSVSTEPPLDRTQSEKASQKDPVESKKTAARGLTRIPTKVAYGTARSAAGTERPRSAGRGGKKAAATAEVAAETKTTARPQRASRRI